MNVRHYLGRLCKRGHDHEGTGQSLRYVTSKACLACNADRVKARGSELHYLGALCKRGHAHEATGKSMRYSTGGMCVVCWIDRSKTPEAREKTREYGRSERNKAKRREAKMNLTPEHLALAKLREQEYGKQYRARHAERRKKRHREYQANRRRTDPVFREIDNLRRRLNCALAGQKVKRCKYGIDYRAIVDHLGPCPGPRGGYHVDHIRPVSSFDLADPDQVREAFAPENHQWLTAAENWSKHAKWDPTAA